jgi:uncharacterized membrane protein
MAPNWPLYEETKFKVAIFGEQVSTSRQIVGRILNFITSISDLWPFWLTPLVHDQQPNYFTNLGKIKTLFSQV